MENKNHRLSKCLIYIMLVIWVAIGLVFYAWQRKFFTEKD